MFALLGAVPAVLAKYGLIATTVGTVLCGFAYFVLFSLIAPYLVASKAVTARRAALK
jgi:hypothetical protein